MAPFQRRRGCCRASALPLHRCLNACACGARLLLRRNCRRKALEARHRLALLLLHRNPRPLARLALAPLLGRPCRALLPCLRRHRLRRVLPRLGQQWRPRFRPLRRLRPARLRPPCRPMTLPKRPALRRVGAWDHKPQRNDWRRRRRLILKP